MENKFTSTFAAFVGGTPESFQKFLSSRRDSPTTLLFPLKFGGYTLFYPSDPAIKEILDLLYAVAAKIEDSLRPLPAIARCKLLRSCLVEGIIQTNDIEGVFSTRKDKNIWKQ